MAIKAKEMTQSQPHEPVSAGTYAARLYSIVHIGTIPVEWQGQNKLVDKVRLTFELPTEKKIFNEEKGEQPYVLSCEFTLSMHEKSNLRKFLEGWQGKKMTEMEAINTDLEEWVGKEGLANVVHGEGKNGITYANISSMTPLPKGMQCPKQINPTFVLNWVDKWSMEKFESLPEFIKDKMKTSSEWIMLHNGQGEEEINLEDIPF